MSTTYPFAKFWRCALQVNPAGYNRHYRGGEHGLDEAAYNQALLEKCQALNIKVVGIADHGSVDSLDALRAFLEPHGIVVFPGFEISSTEKIHMVCLFPEGTSKDQLNRYLGKLGLTDPEETVWPSRLPCLELARHIQELGGFWYAAHMTHSNGLVRLDKDGGGLVHIWQEYKLVRAGQIPGPIADLPPNYRAIVENSDPNWLRERRIAVINAKDVAQPEDLEHPGATCWIKMTQPTFEAFKVAFLDPGSRIRLNSDQPDAPHGRIVALRVSGGYLDGLAATFSENLNAVIGGRGTGKSTLLECLRYVLDVQPKGKQALKLHQEIIKENLGQERGRVEVDLVSSAQHAQPYRVTRSYGEPPIVRDAEGAVSNLLPRDLLPGIEFYGQNEINELAQDAGSRLQLLARLLPGEADFTQQTEQIRKRLATNQQKLLQALGDTDEVKAKLAQLPKLREQLQGYQSLGIESRLAMTPLLARERQLAGRVGEEQDRLRESLATLRENLPDLAFLSDKALDGLPNAALLAPMREHLQSLRGVFESHLAKLEETMRATDGKVEGQLARWRMAVEQGERELEQALRGLPDMAGKSGPEVGVAYQRLLREIEQIRPLETKAASFDQLVAALKQERANLLAELSDARARRTDALRKAAKLLNKRLEGRMRVDIAPEGNRAPLKEFLVNCRLEGVGEKRLAWIDEAESVTPSALVQSIREGAGALEIDWGLTPMVADALARMPVSQILALETAELKDRVEIQLNVAHEGEEQYRPLEKLSTGQQCTAILHLLLLENPDPLVVDQPEDNLDNAFIADRIVSELRDAKTRRQFLFATHNANIPVFGDAEWIGVFTAYDRRGHLDAEAQGSIDVRSIRDQVAVILEGGRDAFIQRKEKYEF